MKKGTHHSEEAKEKIGRGNLGRIPWNKGEHGIYSEETLNKIREANSRRIHTEESRRKRSIKMRGKNAPHYGKHLSEETKQKIRAKTSGKLNHNYGKSMEEKIKQKISKTLLGHKVSDVTRKKISKSKKGKKNYGTFKKGNIPWTHYHGHSDEAKKKMSKKAKGRTTWIVGKHHSEKTKEKIRNKQIKLWQDKDYARKNIEAFHLKPNNCERYLDFLLQNHCPDEWKYVGDGQIIINGLCPDFINVNGKKKIIELFGDYWHNPKKIKLGYNRTEEGRKKAFDRYGYSTLIVWEHELANEEKIVEKIKIFSENDL